MTSLEQFVIFTDVVLVGLLVILVVSARKPRQKQHTMPELDYFLNFEE